MKCVDTLTDELIESILSSWGDRVRRQMQAQWQDVSLAAATVTEPKTWSDPLTGTEWQFLPEEHADTMTLKLEGGEQLRNCLLRLVWEEQEDFRRYDLFVLTDADGNAEVPQLPENLLRRKSPPMVVVIILDEYTDIDRLLQALREADRLPQREALEKWFRLRKRGSIADRLHEIYVDRGL